MLRLLGRGFVVAVFFAALVGGGVYLWSQRGESGATPEAAAPSSPGRASNRAPQPASD
jgi:hypothetical protein